MYPISVPVDSSSLRSLSRCRFWPCLLIVGFVASQLRADTVIQSRIYESNEVVSEWAAYDLETQGTVTVEDGADVRFSAGQRITLKAGFSVEAGGLFQARVSAFPSYDPGGYYGATSPTLTVLSGDEQSGAVDSFNALPFDIAVFDGSASVPLVNAPVMLMVEQGGGGLSTDNSVSSQTSGVLRLLTDSDGTVQAYYKHGGVPNVTSYIRAVAGNQVAQLEAHSVAAPRDPYMHDSDLDGIPDGWEIEKDLDPFDPADAAIIVGGLSNLEIYNQSLHYGKDPSVVNSVGLVIYSP